MPEKTSKTSTRLEKPYEFAIEHVSNRSTGPVLGNYKDVLCDTPVQGTAADITKKALAVLIQRLADTGAQIIGTVHDEMTL